MQCMNYDADAQVYFSVNVHESFDKFIAALKPEFSSQWNMQPLLS